MLLSAMSGVFEKLLGEGRSIRTDRPWTDHFPQSEVWNDGRMLIAELRTDNPRILFEVMFGRDNLILWGK